MTRTPIGYPGTRLPDAWCRPRARGFTLAELLVVVAIVGILAVLGIAGIRGYVTRSRSAEAFTMIQSIRAAEERWRAESRTYLDVSASLDTYYPSSALGRDGHPWPAPDGTPDKTSWELLNPSLPGSQVGSVTGTIVRHGYAVKAGLAGENMNSLTGIPSGLTLESNPPVDWYVVKAEGDLDGDGDPAFYIATNLNAEIWTRDAGD